MNNPSHDKELLLKEGRSKPNRNASIFYQPNSSKHYYEIYLIVLYSQVIKRFKILIIFSGCLGHGDLNVGFVIVKKFHAHYKFIVARLVVTSVNICMLEYLFSVTKKKHV